MVRGVVEEQVLDTGALVSGDWSHLTYPAQLQQNQSRIN